MYIPSVLLLLLCAGLSLAHPGTENATVDKLQAIDERGTIHFHENWVHFQTVGGAPITKVVFTVDDMRIPYGQNPGGLNKIGDVHDDAPPCLFPGLDCSESSPRADCRVNAQNCTRPGINFISGRYGSVLVADWWKSNIYPDQTTFDHAPIALNFGFIGTLELTYMINKDSWATYKFYDVAIGQGHTRPLSSNNWWFGCQMCTYMGEHAVNTTGLDEATGVHVPFSFRRGWPHTTVDDIKVFRELPE